MGRSEENHHGKLDAAEYGPMGMPLYPLSVANENYTDDPSASLTHVQDDPDRVKDHLARGSWGSRVDFILSLLGFSVGLGNVWRFPYLCYQNGGGAFLVPYWLTMFFCGAPLFFLEVAWGQFCSKSSVSCWCLSPILKGVGWACAIATTLYSTFYNILLTYITFYFAKSFTLESLEWSTCGNWWNSNDSCFNYNNETLRDHYNEWQLWTKNASLAPNGSLYVGEFHNGTYKSSSDEYFHRRVLQLSPGITEMGSMLWELVVCLIPVWIITGLCLIRGVKSSGKVVWFTATFPYVVLTIMLIRGVTLDGAIEGIKFYITPDFTYLAKPQTWATAAFQVFYSLGPGWGGLITMGSYNKFHNNCYRDSLFVPIFMGLTSLYAGFAIFSCVGFMAKTIGKPVKDVVTLGPGLAFVLYPEVVTKLPLSQLWAVLFFFMLFTVGLDTEFVMIETAITALWDELPHKYKIKRAWILLAGCIFMFLFSLPFVTQGGMYLFQVCDTYTASYTVVLVSIFETIAIAWIYGADRFLDDIQFMVGYRPNFIFSIIWRFICPAILITLFFVACIEHLPLRLGDYVFPEWAISMGFGFASISLVAIPAYAIYYLFATRGPFLPENIKLTFLPNEDWRPADPADYERWLAYQENNPDYGKGFMFHLRKRIQPLMQLCSRK